VNGLSASNKIYDGTMNATLTGTAALQTAEAPGGPTGDGKPFIGDVVTLGGGAVGTFVSKDVADGITVNVTGLTLGGAQLTDYSLTPPSLSANIAPKALTYTGLTVPASRIYDGTTNTVVSGTAMLHATEAA